MLKRIKYIACFFALLWGYFLLQKPIFMFVNSSTQYELSDYIRVMWHGASLDATTTGYFTIIPFLVSIISLWIKKMPMRRIMVPYYVLVALLTTVIFVGDTSLFSFWESKMDASIFIYIDSPKNVAASVSLWYILARIVVIVVLTISVVWGLSILTPQYFNRIFLLRNRLWHTIAMLPIGCLLFLIIRGGIHVSTANVGNVYFSDNQFLNLSAINPCFNLFSSMERQAKYEDEFNFFGEKKRMDIIRRIYNNESDANIEHMLTTNRPNILIILMESFGATMMEQLSGEKGVSPNLDKLSKEGVFFTNAYASSFRTDRGMVCTFSGYPGLPTLSIMKVANLAQRMPNIANELSKVGYSTEFLYGGDINFTNMRGYLTAGGFQKLISQDDFTIAERNYSKWGVPDNITFNRLADMLDKRSNSTRPWFTAFLTLSSHEPFEVPFQKFKDKHCNAFAFTDNCIGQFIKRFRKSPAWHNTLIVLLPDHGIPYPKKGERFGPRYFHIPIIWTGGVVKEHRVIDRIVSQTDLAATLLAQLGIDYSDFTFSRNVLSDNYCSSGNDFAFYSFVNGFGVVDSTGASVYDNASNRIFYNEKLDDCDTECNDERNIKERITRGKAILQTLYDKLGEINRGNLSK